RPPVSWRGDHGRPAGTVDLKEGPGCGTPGYYPPARVLHRPCLAPARLSRQMPWGRVGPGDPAVGAGAGGPGYRGQRTALLLTLALALLAAPLAVEAQPAAKIARVGVLASSTEEHFEPSVKVFREALHAAGWVEGQNLTLDVRYPGEQYARLAELATELVSL